MSVEMVAVKPLKYRTRRLLPGDHFRVKGDRDAKALVFLKRAERTDNPDRRVALDDARAEVGMLPLSEAGESIAVVRQQYFDKFGRRPFNGWSVAQLREKIAKG